MCHVSIDWSQANSGRQKMMPVMLCVCVCDDLDRQAVVVREADGVAGKKEAGRPERGGGEGGDKQGKGWPASFS